MAHHLSSTRIDDLDVVQVETPALSLALIPDLGGKITSLRDRRTGREWLWRHPRLPYRRVPHGGSYTALADTGGWDECFPTVAPCGYPSPPWAGVALQDHGELWSQPARLETVEGSEGVSLRTRWQGVTLPYSFERTAIVSPDAARLRVDYCVTSEADSPLQFIWCAHPLLAIEPGMRLRLPPAARFNLWSALPSAAIVPDRGLLPPFRVRTGRGEIDLATLPDASAGVALKLWSDPLPEGWVRLLADDGELTLRWDVSSLPQLALWINLGAWAGDGGPPYFNLGVEPCIGAQDSLAEAVARSLPFATLPPRGERRWRLELELRPPAPGGIP